MAAKFLLNPAVGRSSVSHRRSFLEKRGLTSDEIDEAFRLVSNTTSSTVTFGQDINSNQDLQSRPFTSIRLHSTGQSSQPVAASMLISSLRSRFSWSYAIFSLVLLILSGAGTSMLLKKFFLPRLKSWICKVVLEEYDDKRRNSKLSLSIEMIEAAKTTAAASVNAAKASLEILQSKKEEGRYLDVLVRRFGIHIGELRSMSIAIWRLEVAGKASLHKLPEHYIQHTSRSKNGFGSKQLETSTVDIDDPDNFVPSPTKFKPSDISNFESSVRPSCAPLRPSAGQHPKSYMEILAMVQRGEKPPGLKDIDDSPPNPDQPLPSPRITPRIKPWEIAQPQSNFGYTPDKGNSRLNGETAQPWWKRNNAKIREVEAGNGMRTDEQLVRHS